MSPGEQNHPQLRITGLDDTYVSLTNHAELLTHPILLSFYYVLGIVLGFAGYIFFFTDI